ncbi:MAG: M20/M25/M40 family metallo-hydrolase [Acidobacteriaceae bacterium]
MSAAAAQLRVSRLAAEPVVHRAFRWLHLHQPQMRRWLLEVVRTPAPTFGEAARAEWFVERFRSLGLENAHLDEVGNALAELPGSGGPGGRVVLVSAHLDTVFPAGTATEPEEVDGRILAPGVCDNAAGLSGLLGIAASLRDAGWVPPVTVLFAANVGEEGEGNLRGMRHLFAEGSYAGRIAGAIALEGGGSSAVITSALASRRFRIEVRGPGGHSWTNAGAPNPIVQLARAVASLGALDLAGANGRGEEIRAESPRTTLNVGLIAGGTSVNSIPELASAHVDLRSTDTAQLELVVQAMRRAVAEALGESSAVRIETIGDRPGGSLPEDSALLASVRAVDRHLALRTEAGLGSTDANIPLSLGIPAIAIGAGGSGGGIHTLQEWYDPAGREVALRRVLLILMDTVRQTAEDSAA